MTLASLETLFVRYRATGQPEPLGELFDRASPQLLAVALHLCGHPADAEDALQATFVAAIDAAASWDAARPLLPWLNGILTKQCRRIGERRGRRREQALDGEPLVLDDGSPLAASERRELVAKLREHVDRLPGEQRQVVLLQLEHGLAPAQIAEVLGVAPGAVRMRLHRGLQALRGALPAGLAVLLLAALPARGVAAVRTAVVRHAATTAVVVVGGTLAMKKLALLVAIVLVLGAGAVALPFVWSSTAAPPGAGAEAQRVVLAHERAPADAPLVAAAEREAAPVVGPAVSAAGASAATGSLVVVTVRDDGAPVANEPFCYCLEEGEQRPLAPALATDRAGVARIDGLAPGTWRIEFLRGKKVHAEVVAGGVTESRWTMNGDLAAGYVLRCTVVHADGRPAAGATILAAGQMTVPGAAPVGLTDAHGRCDVELRSNLCVGARLASFGAARPMYCYPRRDLTLTLGGPEAVVEGTVVDSAGVPIAGALVEIGPSSSWVAMERVGPDVRLPPTATLVTTDGAGRCTARELLPLPLRVRIRAPGCAAFEDALLPVAGQATARRWQLTKGEVLEGRVVDEAGQPRSAAITIGPPRSGMWRSVGDDGRFRIPNAPIDEPLHVQSDDCDARTLTIPELRAANSTIVLQSLPRYELRLCDERGAPLANWWVVLQHRGIAARRTDAAGRVAALVRNGLPELWVGPPTAHGPGCPLPWPAGAAPGAEVVVVVPDALHPTAIVRGTLFELDGKPSRRFVELRGANGLVLLHAAAKAGRFEFPGVPAGDWSVHAGGSGNEPIDVPALRPGEVRELGELRRPPPGQVRIDVRTPAGERPHGLRIFVAGPGGSGSDTDVPTDAAATLAPGRYTWQVYAEGSAWRAGEVDVHAGAVAEVDVVLPPGLRRSLCARVAGVAGAAEGIDWCLRDAAGVLAYRAPREELTRDRCLELHPTLSPGEWRLEVVVGAERRFEGRFEVTAAQRMADTIEIALTPTR